MPPVDERSVRENVQSEFAEYIACVVARHNSFAPMVTGAKESGFINSATVCSCRKTKGEPASKASQQPFDTRQRNR